MLEILKEADKFYKVLLVTPLKKISFSHNQIGRDCKVTPYDLMSQILYMLTASANISRYYQPQHEDQHQRSIIESNVIFVYSVIIWIYVE